MAAANICYPGKSLNPQTSPFTAIYAHCAPIKHREQVPTPINNPVTAATLQGNVSYHDMVTFSWSLGPANSADQYHILEMSFASVTRVIHWIRRRPSEYQRWFTGVGSCIVQYCNCAVTANSHTILVEIKAAAPRRNTEHWRCKPSERQQFNSWWKIEGFSKKAPGGCTAHPYYQLIITSIKGEQTLATQPASSIIQSSERERW